MRRATISEYDKLAELLANYVGVMKYRFMNLCIKSEPAALVPIEVKIEGEVKKLEECCKVSKDDDYHFKLFPDYDDDIPAIRQGVTKSHPEFKQEIKSLSIPIPDEKGGEKDYEVKYIELTMPEVDDDRFDVLKNAAKVIYEECKVQMETANAKSKAAFAQLVPQESKDDADRLYNELDTLYTQRNEHRDKLYEAKLDEITSAYNKWLAQQARNEIAKMEKEDAEGTSNSIKLNRKYE